MGNIPHGRDDPLIFFPDNPVDAGVRNRKPGRSILGQAKAVLRRINKYVEKNFENVGKKFYKEVKKSQAGKRDEKFYGTPSEEEVSKLLDEGVDLFHVPKVKDN